MILIINFIRKLVWLVYITLNMALHFTKEEFNNRKEKVLSSMKKQNIDLLEKIFLEFIKKQKFLLN